METPRALCLLKHKFLTRVSKTTATTTTITTTITTTTSIKVLMPQLQCGISVRLGIEFTSVPCSLDGVDSHH